MNFWAYAFALFLIIFFQLIWILQLFANDALMIVALVISFVILVLALFMAIENNIFVDCFCIPRPNDDNGNDNGNGVRIGNLDESNIVSVCNENSENTEVKLEIETIV